MRKEKTFKRTRFSADVIKEAALVFSKQANPQDEKKPKYTLSVSMDSGNWTYDSLDEFYADYRRSTAGAYFDLYYDDESDDFQIQVVAGSVTVCRIKAPDRAKIEAVFDVFERHALASRIPEPPSPPPPMATVFIGHGRSPLWRDLKDHLHEKHGYSVEAYEIGARAGHAVRHILAEMIENSSFALLVMTGEDETVDGELRARQNVIHEAGLFQGALGFSRAIVLLEEGTEEFSNIAGIDQIRFTKGNIKETFGEVLATLKREFQD